MEPNKQTEVVIVGASSSGLSVAAYFQKNNIPYVLLEQKNVVGHQWRNFYDRLHLHTPKSMSNLPFFKMPSSYEKYVSREKVVAYFEEYIEKTGIKPVYNTTVKSVEKNNDIWKVKTDKGIYTSKYVVVATGNTKTPKMVAKKGLESFKGAITHSIEYKNGKAFKGKNVLVVGFGNSACEIAICLTEHGANASLSVRSKVNVLPRDILGVSTMKVGMLTDFLPPKVADVLNKPVVDAFIGDIRKLGLKKSDYGAKEQVAKTGKIPLLDIGTVDLIKKGKIRVFGDIVAVNNETISFEDNKKGNFDAIIFATGFNHNLQSLVPEISDKRLKDIKIKISKRKHLGEGNIYFAGYHVSLNGMIRECGIEAKCIYNNILQKKHIR